MMPDSMARLRTYEKMFRRIERYADRDLTLIADPVLRAEIAAARMLAVSWQRRYQALLDDFDLAVRADEQANQNLGEP
jgi:hypothetical protein